MAEAKYCENTRETAEEPPAYTPSSSQPPLPSCQDMEQDVQLSTHEPTSTTLSGLEVESAPPPSYESLHGQAKAMKAESSGNVDFKEMTKLFLYIFLLLVLMGLLLGVPVCIIVIGAKYKDDCPAERYIPIYLIVAGSFEVLRSSIDIMQICCQKEDEKEEDMRKIDPIEFFFDCILFAWVIAGSMWIYRTKGEFSTTPGDSNFCEPILYWFAFVFTTAVFLGLGCKYFRSLFAMCRGSDHSKKAQAWPTP